MRVRGLTLTGGRANEGGGIHFFDGGELLGCRVIANHAESSGGGVYGFNIIVSNCVVARNTANLAAGGLLMDSLKLATIGIWNSVISNNTVNNTAFGYAEGGGVRITAMNAAAWIVNCHIVDNVAEGVPYKNHGGGLHVTGAKALTVRNTLIARNVARDKAGGAWVNLGTTFQNCTIAGNKSDGEGSGLYLATAPNDSFPCRIENSIIHNNISKQAASPWLANVHVWFEQGLNWFENVSVGNAPGRPALPGRNISYAYPRFLHGWDLSARSPCVDAGSNQPWMNGARDLAGRPRSAGNNVDLGCFETQPGARGAGPEHDYDGDGRSDLALYWSGYWAILHMAGGLRQNYFGHPTCTALTGDYDDDGIADLVIYQEESGYWGFQLSRTQKFEYLWLGGPDCLPLPGDYDGNGIADLAIYHVPTGGWYYRALGKSLIYGPFYVSRGADEAARGKPVDPDEYDELRIVPVSGDFDGDGRTDFSEMERSTGYWRIKFNTGYMHTVGLASGGAGGIPVAGDFDGDFKDDPAIFNPTTGAWKVFPSAYGYAPMSLSVWAGGMPVRGDYDGDGRDDLITYNPADYFWQGYMTRLGWVRGQFGAPDWRPVR